MTDLKDRIKDFEDRQQLRNDKLFDWYRNIMNIAIGLFGILITLTPKSESETDYYLFSFAIAILGLSILLSVIALYIPIQIDNKLIKLKGENLISIMDGNKPTSANINPSRLLNVIKRISYITYCISLILLVVYAIVIKEPL